jgi:hypothetical protein
LHCLDLHLIHEFWLAHFPTTVISLDLKVGSCICLALKLGLSSPSMSRKESFEVDVSTCGGNLILGEASLPTALLCLDLGGGSQDGNTQLA